jgi:glycosyltransferase involved in cell wall biosynthesis
MKILHIITTIDIGGAEKQLLELSRSQVLAGHEIYVAYLKEIPRLREQFTDCGVSVIETLYGKSAIRQPWILRQVIKIVAPDLVHYHLPRAELIGAIASFPEKYFVSRHNMERFLPSGSLFLSKLLSKLVTRRAWAVIAISNSVSLFLINSGEISRRTMTVTIPYGISSSEKEIALKQPKDASLIFGTLSRLTPQKDIPCLLEGFAIHLKNHPNDVLRIAGVGELQSELINFSASLNIDERVEWLGKVPNADEFLNNLDVFILTSKYEGFGLVILESLRSGVVLLSSKSEAAIEILGEEYKGLFGIHDSKSLANLMGRMREREFRVTLQKQGVTVLPQYSIEKTVESHDRLYLSVKTKSQLKKETN